MTAVLLSFLVTQGDVNMVTNVTVKEGEDVRLNCIISRESSVSWKRDGAGIETSSRVKIEDSVLVILNSSTDDVGAYVCTKNTPQGQSTQTFNLWLNGK